MPLAAPIGALALFFLPPIHGTEPVPEDEQTVVIALRHQPAEEVIPALEPHMAGRRVSLSASGDRLLLRGTTQELGALIDLIAAVDIPPRMLWVTLALDDEGHSADRHGGLNDTPAEAGEGNGSPALSDALGDATYSFSRWRTGRVEARRVLVRDGDWASVTVRGVSRASGLYARVQATPQIEVFTSDLAGSGDFHDSGFRVRPRLAGDLVTLEVDIFGSDEDPVSSRPITRALATTLTGRVGDWIPVTGPADLQPEDTVARTRRAGTPSVLLRVDPADSRDR